MKSLLDDPLLAKVPDVFGYRTLGPVALFAEIGRGGMGAVYRGRHLNLDIDVAVKCLLDTTGDADLIARFRREAMLVARIRSPHLVQVMDVRNEYGLHYIVMEFVAGETVEGRIRRRGALPPNEAVAIALAAAKGLAAAHQKGVIHRDVKPGNVLLSTDGEVKLLDLGIAKGKSETVEVEATLTTTVMGTPLYMPPEQFESAANVTPAADVYSLGATLAFMLLGQHAIKGRTLPEITREVTVRGFPDLQPRAPHLPPDVVALVKRATAMDPAARHADAKALAADLQCVLTALGGAPALADADAMRPPSDAVPAPTPSVLAEIRRSVTTRSQPNLEAEDEAEDEDDDEPDAGPTVRKLRSDAAPEVAPTPERAPPKELAAAGATVSMPGPGRASPSDTDAAAIAGPRRRSSVGVYAALLLLGGGAAAVAWHYSRPEAPRQTPVTDVDKVTPTGPGDNGANGEGGTRSEAPTRGEAANPSPTPEPKTPPAVGDTGKNPTDGRGTDGNQPAANTQPAGPPSVPSTATTTDAPGAKPDPGGTKLDPVKTPDATGSATLESATKSTPPATNSESPATNRTEVPPNGEGVAGTAKQPEAKPETVAPRTDEPAPKVEPPATTQPAPTQPTAAKPEPPVPVPTAAEVLATAIAGARLQAKAADWNGMVTALDQALAAVQDESMRSSWRGVADELLARLRATLPENLATAASERAARVAAWNDALPRFARGGCGMAALLLVEGSISYDLARDTIVCSEPQTVLAWARTAAADKVARGAFYAGELLRLDVARLTKVDGKDPWDLVHDCYRQGMELGDGDCAARIAGIYFAKRAKNEPPLWRPQGIDNLDAWAARLARQARTAGVARGHFMLSQFLLLAVQNKEFSKSSGLSETRETTYPLELEQAARLGYAPALAELRRKESDEKLRWATDALQRLRREGVIDR